jgi:hypothetical protein
MRRRSRIARLETRHNPEFRERTFDTVEMHEEPVIEKVVVERAVSTTEQTYRADLLGA